MDGEGRPDSCPLASVESSGTVPVPVVSVEQSVSRISAANSDIRGYHTWYR